MACDSARERSPALDGASASEEGAPQDAGARDEPSSEDAADPGEGTVDASGAPDPVAQQLGVSDWQPLLDAQLSKFYRWLPSQGRDRDPQGVFAMKGEELHVLAIPVPSGDQEFGYLATRQDYSDYRLRLEQRWGARKFAPRADVVRDSGLLYHVRGADQLWPQCVEFQIQEGDTGDLWLLSGTGTTTRLNAAMAFDPAGPERTLRATGFVGLSRAEVEESAGGWNALELIVSGSEFVHLVNGRLAHRGRALEYLDQGSWQALSGGRIALQAEGAEVQYRNVRLAPLPYAPPPAEGELLLGGATLDGWQHIDGSAPRWHVVDGALEVEPGSGDLVSASSHGDVRLHLEFRVPRTLDPDAQEQDRGNSGVFLQGRYEVQVLDSFGRSLADNNDAAAIYGSHNADSNEALPPELWQTYDILFMAPRWRDGVKTAPARISVSWNGTLVQREVEVNVSTGDAESPSPGPLRLQDHGHRVRYRNVWLQRL